MFRAIVATEFVEQRPFVQAERDFDGIGSCFRRKEKNPRCWKLEVVADLEGALLVVGTTWVDGVAWVLDGTIPRVAEAE